MKPPPNTPLFFETVKERFCGHVVSSDIRPATASEIEIAEMEHHEGNCRHQIVWDEPGWMYDYRWCATCGVGLGAI